MDREGPASIRVFIGGGGDALVFKSVAEDIRKPPRGSLVGGEAGNAGGGGFINSPPQARFPSALSADYPQLIHRTQDEVEAAYAFPPRSPIGFRSVVYRTDSRDTLALSWCQRGQRCPATTSI
jgi:hypothetical protein